MDATAVRVGALTPQEGSGSAKAAAKAPGKPAAGGGPVSAPTKGALLGVTLLPAPAGAPQIIHLNDGTVMVPLARIDAAGNRLPLTGGGALAPKPAAPAVPHVATAATPAAPANVEPKGFLFRGKYYKKFEDNSAINVADMKAVHDKVTRATLDHVLHDEPDFKGFGVTNIKVRRSDRTKDADLHNIDPKAMYLIDVEGVTGTGQKKSIPSVMNADGTTFVDPKLRNG